MLSVPWGYGVDWYNADIVAHTVTSFEDAGATFDSGPLVLAGDRWFFDTSALEVATYEYFCIVHPWMQSTMIIEDSGSGRPGHPRDRGAVGGLVAAAAG